VTGLRRTWFGSPERAADAGAAADQLEQYTVNGRSILTADRYTYTTHEGINIRGAANTVACSGPDYYGLVYSIVTKPDRAGRLREARAIEPSYIMPRSPCGIGAQTGCFRRACNLASGATSLGDLRGTSTAARTRVPARAVQQSQTRSWTSAANLLRTRAMKTNMPIAESGEPTALVLGLGGQGFPTSTRPEQCRAGRCRYPTGGASRRSSTRLLRRELAVGRDSKPLVQPQRRSYSGPSIRISETMRRPRGTTSRTDHEAFR
jgi:hypothetical protein